MNRMWMVRAVLLLLALLIAACGPGSVSPHHAVGDDGETLRRDFNAAAWDMFLVFTPDARWEGRQPPVPHYWMHQLGTPTRPRVNGPFLDANVFSDRVAALLPKVERTRPAAARSGALGAPAERYERGAGGPAGE